MREKRYMYGKKRWKSKREKNGGKGGKRMEEREKNEGILQGKNRKGPNYILWGTWPAESEDYVTLDLSVEFESHIGYRDYLKKQ